MSAESSSLNFDHNATTPLDPRVREAMWPWFLEQHGNPSSAHAAGRAARDAVEKARRQVAELLGAKPEEILFTASGTEANNGVIETVAQKSGDRGEIVVSALEHPSIRAAAARAERRGMTVRELVPGPDGRVSARHVEDALSPQTQLVAVMLANNELGTLQPVAEIAARCAEQGVPVLCDAVQAVGKIPVDVEELGVSYLCLGGHKFYGPPGVAALWTHPDAELEPWLVGGGQEQGRRASTENLPSVVGLGLAAELARQELTERGGKLRALRDRFELGLEALDGAIVHCRQSPRLPNTSHVAFEGISGHALMLWLDDRGVAVSTGSACHAGTPQPSPALLAMGVDAQESLASLRISFGVTHTPGDVDSLLAELAIGVGELRRVGD